MDFSIYVDARPAKFPKIAIFNTVLMECEVLEVQHWIEATQKGRASDHLEAFAIQTAIQKYPQSKIFSDSQNAVRFFPQAVWVERESIGIRICDRCLKKPVGVYAIEITGKQHPLFRSTLKC